MNLFVCRYSVCHSIPAIVHVISATVVRRENIVKIESQNIQSKDRLCAFVFKLMK